MHDERDISEGQIGDGLEDGSTVTMGSRLSYIGLCRAAMSNTLQKTSEAKPGGLR